MTEEKYHISSDFLDKSMFTFSLLHDGVASTSNIFMQNRQFFTSLSIVVIIISLSYTDSTIYSQIQGCYYPDVVDPD